MMAATLFVTNSPAQTVGELDTINCGNILFEISTDKVVPRSHIESAAECIDFQTDSIVKVIVSGYASIDGPEETNNQLAKLRMEKLRALLSDTYNIPSHKLVKRYTGEDWKLFRQLVEADSLIPGRDSLLQIIDMKIGNDSKEAKIRHLQKGATWEYLSRTILPLMRSTSVEWYVWRPAAKKPEPEEPVVVENTDIIQEQPEVVTVVEEVVEEEIIYEDDWYRKMYIKTNAPAWALLWQNAAVEFDLAKHWSVSLPLYWSPYNYGKQTLKFRTLAFVPEVRYWPNADNMGFFVNAHFGLAEYNYAKDGEYRYQDHDGKTPAIGGGIGVGYRFYFCKNHHWSMEVAVGAGVYKLDYDIFLNTPSTKHGYLIGRHQRTFYGIDQAALTFSYSFGLRKKGGDK